MTRSEYMAVVRPHDRARENKVLNERVERILQVETIVNQWRNDSWEVVGSAVVARSLTDGTGFPRLILKRPVE